MSAPKTIFIGGIEAGKLTWQWNCKIDLEWDCHHEYRLVDPNEQSKIERIKAEINLLPCHLFAVDKRRVIEIIDRISNENDVPVIGGDS